MLAQLFRLLVRESIFDSPDRQRIVVSHILREIYHNDKETANQVAYPAMQMALGINALTKSDHNGKAPRQSSNGAAAGSPDHLNLSSSQRGAESDR